MAHQVKKGLISSGSFDSTDFYDDDVDMLIISKISNCKFSPSNAEVHLFFSINKGNQDLLTLRK